MKFASWALGVFFLDRFTKMIVQRFLVEGDSIPVIDNVFHITHYRNPGAAFNLFAYKTPFFIGITVVVLAVILYYSRQIPKDKHLARAALALQFGGAAGNLVDRIFGGYVIDFLDFRVWPVFNIADSAIVIGVILLSWEIITWPAEDDQEQES